MSACTSVHQSWRQYLGNKSVFIVKSLILTYLTACSLSYKKSCFVFSQGHNETKYLMVNGLLRPVHYPQIPFRYACSVCEKKYRRRAELKVHMYIHTGDRPHQCSICGLKFRLRQGLTRHLQTHNKSDKYMCNVCGQCFSQERYLRSHVRVHKEKKR